MLERLRSSMQSGFTYILVAALTVIFMFFFGMPTNSCSGGAGRTNAYLASVGGTSLYSNDVDLVFNRVYRGGGSMDEDQYIQRRAKALRAVVLIHLFANRAEEAGFRVGEKELKEYMKDPVRNMEFRFRYGRNGEWYGEGYQNYVQNLMQTTLRKYEAFKRRELLANKYLASKAAQTEVSPLELQDAYEIRNTKLNLEFVKFDPETLDAYVDVTDEAVKKFAESNPDRLKSYYDKNKSDYSNPTKYRIRRVYIEKPGDGSPQKAKDDAKERWEKAQKRVFEQGDDVATVAAELGEDFQQENKGLMDWSTKKNTDKTMLQAIKDASVGDVKKVEADYAYMLVKLEDKQEATSTPLEEVKTEIARKLLKQDRADGLLAEVSKKLLEKAENAETLGEAVKTLRKNTDRKLWTEISAEETGNFTLQGRSLGGGFAAQLAGMMPGNSWARVPQIGTSTEIAATAYKKLSKDKPLADKIFSVDGSRVIIRLKSRQAPEGDGPDIKTAYNLSEKKESLLLGNWEVLFMNGRWQRFWSRGTTSFGTWIDRQLSQAVESGVVTFNEKAQVARQVAGSFKPAGKATSPKTQKGGPATPKTIEVNPTKGKSGSEKN